MKRPVKAAACLVGGIVWAVGAIGAAHAQENPMLGSWTAIDPGTGVHDVVTVTSENIIFGAAAPPIPYRLEQETDGLALYLAEAEDPAHVTFLDDANAQLSVPGGPTIALQRQMAAAAGEEKKKAEPPLGAIEAAAASLLPPAETEAFDPLNPSLRGLLAEGYKLDHIKGTDSGVTLLMSNGGRHAFCILVPAALDTPGGAASDCRRLN